MSETLFPSLLPALLILAFRTLCTWRRRADVGSPVATLAEEAMTP
jgi:hypothetical protein